MNRAGSALATKKRKLKERKQAKGYYGSKHKLTKTIREQLMRSWRYSYIGRKQKKRNFRRLWIIRINNFCRDNGTNYSRFMRFLKLSQIGLDRKALSEMMINNPELIKNLVVESVNKEYKEFD